MFSLFKEVAKCHQHVFIYKFHRLRFITVSLPRDISTSIVMFRFQSNYTDQIQMYVLTRAKLSTYLLSTLLENALQSQNANRLIKAERKSEQYF